MFANVRRLSATLWVLLMGPAWALPDIQHWVTENGARVYFVETRELPIVDLRIVFDAGAARDGATPGLAKFTNGLLSEGAGNLNADQIAEQLADLGVELETSSLRDMALVGLRSMSDPAVLEPAATLVALLLRQPAFPPEAIERVRKQLLVAIRQEQQSPQRVAERAFYAEVYPHHPYGIPPNGTEESVSTLQQADLMAFHARYYVARNAVVAIVGDLDRAAAQRLAERVTADLPPGESAPSLPPVPSPQNSPRMHPIPFPSTQTHILMGQPGIARKDDDFYPLYIVNHALGGNGLVSLLADEIRQQRGLAYNVYSYFSPMRVEGPFVVGLQTRTDKAQEAITVIQEVLARYIREGPSEDQFIAAKKNILGGFPLRIDSNRNLLDYIALIGFYDLPLDYLLRFRERIEAVDLSAARAAFARIIHSDRLVTVAVGTPAPEKSTSTVPAVPGPALPSDAHAQP